MHPFGTLLYACDDVRSALIRSVLSHHIHRQQLGCNLEGSIIDGFYHLGTIIPDIVVLLLQIHSYPFIVILASEVLRRVSTLHGKLDNL